MPPTLTVISVASLLRRSKAGSAAPPLAVEKWMLPTACVICMSSPSLSSSSAALAYRNSSSADWMMPPTATVISIASLLRRLTAATSVMLPDA